MKKWDNVRKELRILLKKVTSYDDKINKLMESIGLTSLNYGNYALVKQWLINGSSDEEILGTLKIMQNAQNKPKIRPIKVASIKVLTKEDADALEALFVPEDELEQMERLLVELGEYIEEDNIDKIVEADSQFLSNREVAEFALEIYHYSCPAPAHTKQLQTPKTIY